MMNNLSQNMNNDSYILRLSLFIEYWISILFFQVSINANSLYFLTRVVEKKDHKKNIKIVLIWMGKSFWNFKKYKIIFYQSSWLIIIYWCENTMESDLVVIVLFLRWVFINKFSPMKKNSQK